MQFFAGLWGFEMKFEKGTVYIQHLERWSIKWTVLERTANTVTVRNQKWMSDVFTKNIEIDGSGVEFITFTLIFKGRVYADAKSIFSTEEQTERTDTHRGVKK
jgi:hypothetical protein